MYKQIRENGTGKSEMASQSGTAFLLLHLGLIRFTVIFEELLIEANLINIPN
ncbi:hypothetical protein CA2015_3403 [Cyclobacterium amurskyense]|uniref:Uncharacterized protein n=1 Tax=Cyclobacterium amurskyense TaxID=320787 RepID=A0A0H4PWN9_9BACT|nr:hypothetical protein CA2015_3403 [Cyclobacterium amurskyense]|tara:strand:- start:810 stop:965 length:156 start_codon:yes stop_codon:yes gene_type:complete